MRAIAPTLLLVPTLLLAGCTQQDGGDGGSFDVTCPQWTEDPHPVGTVTSIQFYNRREDAVPGASRTESQLFPLDGRTPPPLDRRVADRYHLALPGNGVGAGIKVDNGTLEVRALRADDNTTLRFFEAAAPADRKESLRFGSGAYDRLDWYVDLGPADRDPVGSALRLDWTFTPGAGLVPNSGLDGGPRVGASYSVTAYVAYRAPGCNA